VLGRNPRGRGGCRWLEAAVRAWEGVGKLGRSREGVGEEWGRGNEWSSASRERAARRQHDRGERGGKIWGVPAWGCHVARARRSRATCAARACAGRTERWREASDGWAAAQCRAAVPLTGGAGLSAGAVESAGARGLAREESGVAEAR
jgi:hypothetical protein